APGPDGRGPAPPDDRAADPRLLPRHGGLVAARADRRAPGAGAVRLHPAADRLHVRLPGLRLGAHPGRAGGTPLEAAWRAADGPGGDPAARAGAPARAVHGA